MTFFTRITTPLFRRENWPPHNWLMLLILIAFLVRVVGVWADWPFGFLHIDEGFHIRNATQLAHSGELAPDNLIYPTGFPLSLIIPVGFSVVAGFVAGSFTSIDEVVARFLVEPGFIYTASRVWVAILGALTIGLVFKIGKDCYGKRAGLIASLFLTFSLLHVEVSHWALPEVQVGFLVTASLLFCLKYWRSGAARDFLLASALFGLAVSTKQSALPLALSLLAVWLMVRSSMTDDRRWMLHALYAVLIAVIVFVVTSPVYLTQFSSAFSENLGSDGENGFSKLATGKIGLFDGPDYFWTFQMWLVKDLLIAALGISGIVFAITRRTKPDVLLGLFVIGFFGVAATLAVHQIHYIVPVLPAAFVFAGRFTDWGLCRAQVLGSTYVRLVFVGLVAIVSVGVIQAVVLNIGLTGTDTRLQAREWVLSNIDSGETIAITNVVYGSPLHDPSDRRFFGDSAIADAEVRAHISSYLGETTTYEIVEQLGDGDGVLIPPEEWNDIGWDYVMVSSFDTDQFLVNEPPPADNPLRPMYERGRSHYLSVPKSPYVEVVAAFDPSFRHPGPSLVIYRVLKVPQDPG